MKLTFFLLFEFTLICSIMIGSSIFSFLSCFLENLVVENYPTRSP